MRGKGKLTEADIKIMMREVRLALLEADVNFKVVKEFIKNSIRTRIRFRCNAIINTRATSY